MLSLCGSLVIVAIAVLWAPSVNADPSPTARRVWLEQIGRKLEAEGFELNATRITDHGYTLEVRYKDAAAAGFATCQRGARTWRDRRVSWAGRQRQSGPACHANSTSASDAVDGSSHGARKRLGIGCR